MFPEFYRMIDELHEDLVGVWKPSKDGISQWRECENGLEFLIKIPLDYNKNLYVMSLFT